MRCVVEMDLPTRQLELESLISCMNASTERRRANSKSFALEMRPVESGPRSQIAIADDAEVNGRPYN